MTNMHTIREWIERGCDPSEEYAPTIELLDRLERDDLIVRLERFGANHPMWYLMPRGVYEADRCQHRDERAARESDAQRAGKNLTRALRGPAQ